MERAKTLCELRRPEIHVPDHFRQKSFSRHVNKKNLKKKFFLQIIF